MKYQYFNAPIKRNVLGWFFLLAGNEPSEEKTSRLPLN
jgi:hypothetical protein